MKVTWVIDVDAASPREAAEQALRIQRDPDSTATVFTVSTDSETRRVDLAEDTEELLWERGMHQHMAGAGE